MRALVSVSDKAGVVEFCQNLVRLGYKSTPMVSDIGEFSLRGDILDIYTFSNYPFRIEFFSDTVEEIRIFDAYTQKSIEAINQVEIFPLYKFILDESHEVISFLSIPFIVSTTIAASFTFLVITPQ